ncbi:MAG: phage head closure protein [Clostridioides difficile]
MRRIRKNKKITILERLEKQNEIGGFESTYEPIEELKNIWAYYRHLSGKEIFAAGAESSKVEVIFVVNWKEELIKISPVNIKVLYNKEEYEVTRIDDFEGGKTDIKIYAYKIN